MNSRELLQEVDRRVAERIVPLLLEEGIRRHIRSKDWRECDCQYCSLRRRASLHIANRIVPPGMTFSHRLEDNADFGEVTKSRREDIRRHFRHQLEKLVDEL